MEKRLYKSNKNAVLCGVCGGIGEYFHVDPVVIRLAWVVFCCLGGSGIIAYIIAAIIIPKKPIGDTYSKINEEEAKTSYKETYKVEDIE